MRIIETTQLSAEKKVRLRLAWVSSFAVAPAILEAGSAGADASSSELSESVLSVSLEESESGAEAPGPSMASISALASEALADTMGLSWRDMVRRNADGRSSDSLVKPLDGRRDVAEVSCVGRSEASMNWVEGRLGVLSKGPGGRGCGPWI